MKIELRGMIMEVNMNDSSGRNGMLSVVFLSSVAALMGMQVSNAGTNTTTQQDVQGSTYEKSQPISQAPEATVPQTTPDAADVETQTDVESEAEATLPHDTGSQSSLYHMNADEIIGKTVVTSDGTELGEVDTLAKKPSEGDQVYAVVSAGGVLGIGGEKVVIDLKDLTLVDDQLQTSSIQSEEQLKQQPQFNEEEYVQVEETDRPISEFAGFEPKRQP
ncbi:MAG: PRC-barrel domain-containing protein [Gammaproteobacteria bacterium]